MKWLAEGADRQVLAEIQGEAVELRPWAGAGDELVRELQAVAASLSADRLQDLAIAAMDRYARLTIGADGRTVLPTHLSHHLAASETEVVRIVVRGGRIWLWSEANWRKERERRYLELDALLKDEAAPQSDSAEGR